MGRLHVALVVTAAILGVSIGLALICLATVNYPLAVGILVALTVLSVTAIGYYGTKGQE